MRTRFTLPPDVINRPALTERLEKCARAKITYVYADIGRGKTTAVCMWLRQYKRRHAWIYDKDNYGLLQTGLRTEGGTSLYILDDVQTMGADAFAQVLRQIVNSARYAHFVLISRGAPPACCREMLATGEMQLVTDDELFFSTEERMDFARGAAPYAGMRALADMRADARYGWALALRIRCNALRESRGVTTQTLEENVTDALYAFVNEDVASWPADVLRMLSCVTVMEPFGADAMRAVCLIDDADALLEKTMISCCVLRRQRWDQYELRTDFWRGYFAYVRKAHMPAAEVRAIHTRAGQWYESRGEYADAIGQYVHAEEYRDAVRMLEMACDVSGTLDVLSRRQVEIAHIPLEFMRRSPGALFAMALYCYVVNNDEEMRYWRGALCGAVAEYGGGDDAGAWEMALQCLRALDADCRPAELVSAMLRQMEAHRVLRHWFLGGMPSVINSARDVSAWAHHAPFARRLVEKKPNVRNRPYYDALLHCAQGEVAYWRDKLDDAVPHLAAAAAVAADAMMTPLLFAAQACTARMFAVRGESESAMLMIDAMEKRFGGEEKSAICANLHALRTELGMYTGADGQAWLAQEAPNEYAGVTVMNRMAMLVKAKVYLLERKFVQAHYLLGLLTHLCRTRGLDMDLCRTLLLCAVAYTRQGESGMALECVEKAMLYAQSRNFVRLIADEGHLLLDTLRACDEPLRLRGVVRISFLERAKTACETLAARYPKYTIDDAVEPDKVPALTRAEMAVLKWMGQGKTNGEIAAALSTSVNTVKSHAKRINVKLGVNSRALAILRARQMKLI